MPVNEFEKQVQQKLDELQLRPSPAVWTDVEKQIRRKDNWYDRQVQCSNFGNWLHDKRFAIADKLQLHIVALLLLWQQKLQADSVIHKLHILFTLFQYRR